MPVYRIEVRAIHPADDPSGAGTLGEIRQLGINAVADVRTTRIFLLQGPAELLTSLNLERIAREVLIDPVTETFSIAGGDETQNAEQETQNAKHETQNGDGEGVARVIEVHLKPGVMDPVAASCEMAIADLLTLKTQNAKLETQNGEGETQNASRGTQTPQIENRKSKIENSVEVRTGRKYVLLGRAGGEGITDDLLRVIARRLLVNELIETGHFEPLTPAEFPTGHPYAFQLAHVAVRELTDEQLLELSRKGHLFLDLREMQAIQAYFRQLERDPTDVELETLAQTWSEHCVHKTLKATVEFTEMPNGGNGNGKARAENGGPPPPPCRR